MKTLPASFFAVMMILPLSLSWAQKKPDEDLFRKGLESYRNGRYSEAGQAFTGLQAEYPSSAMRSASAVMAAKTFLHRGYYYKSRQAAGKFLADYPVSGYRGQALWTLAQSAYRSGDFRAAFKAMDDIRKDAQDPSSQKTADSMMIQMIRHVMTVDDVSAAIDSAEGAMRAKLQLELALKYESMNRRAKALSVITGIPAASLPKPLRKDLMSLQNRVSAVPEGAVHIGVIASLTGDDSDLGIPMLEGIELAVNRYNQNKEPKIRLHVMDNHSDIITGVKKARELLASDRLSLLIGPPGGYAMIAVAAEAQRYRVPVLSPNTALNRLTELGENVFQANIDRDARFQILADHAVRELNLKTFAVLAPSDEYGEEAVKSFSRKIRSLGGNVVAVERYYEGTKDFRSQLIRIRKIGLIAEQDRNLTHEKTAGWSMRTVDSLYALYYPAELDDKEMYASPLTSVDGLFMPVYEEDVAYLPPQIAFYNIRAHWLGGDHWNQLQALKQHQSYINGLTFTLDYRIDADDRKTAEFIAAYRAAYRKNPERESFFGYDLMAMIVSYVEKGAYDRDDFRERFGNGVEWNGLHNRIVFRDGSRVNSAVHIMEFRNSVITKIK